jgi:hypothetical protein
VTALTQAISFGLAVTAQQAAEVEAAQRSASLIHLVSSAHKQQGEAAKALEGIKQAEADAQRSLEALKKAVIEVGVSEEAAHFSKRAKGHRTQGNLWLAITVLLGVLTAFYAWKLAFNPNFIPNVVDLRTFYVQIAGRAILASLLLWALVSAQRNYKAHRHNEILNSHRTTALTTFETFVKGTSDDDTKNAVLLQTTQSIFAVQPTGYLANEPEPTPQTTIVEVLRRIGEKP